jgi:hypothetical protein
MIACDRVHDHTIVITSIGAPVPAPVWPTALRPARNAVFSAAAGGVPQHRHEEQSARSPRTLPRSHRGRHCGRRGRRYSRYCHYLAALSLNTTTAF